MIVVQGIEVSVSHNGRVVTASASADDEHTFSACLSACDMALSYFRSTNTNYWGSDGIGYMVQEKSGTAIRHKSTVGPIQYRNGLKALQQNFPVAA